LDKKNIEFPNSPLCDIILITFNGLEFTKKCVESIESNTKDIHYRYIFVDNNSTDGTLEYLKTVPNSVLISNTENLGFVKAMNQGFEKVIGKYVVWLNNDTIVTPNWLSILVKDLENNPNASAIGPMSNGTGVMQSVDEWDGKPTQKEVSNFAKKFHEKNKDQVFEYHRIAGFCIVMKSELIAEIGKLDETFNVGGYDDDDYCKRIREAGYKILIAEDVFIYHKSGATFSRAKDPDFDLAFLMQKGRRRFLRKWISPRKNKDSLTPEDEPLVSIIMATKDRLSIIPNAINSVINQNYKNWELVLVNDGGQSLEELVMKYSDTRIKYINLETNRGKSHANNLGIKKSNGEIIAYLDDDDRWYPNHLELAVKELTKCETRKLVYTDHTKVECIMDSNGMQYPLRKEIIELKEARSNSIDNMNFIPNLSVVHKKTLIDMVGNYDEKLDYYEDWDLLRRFSKCSYFVHVPEVTGEYWINQTGHNRNTVALLDKNLKNVMKYIKNKEIFLSDSVVTQLTKADKMVKKNILQEAFAIYKEILEKDPDFYPAVEGCADRLFSLKDYSKSQQYWNKLIMLNPIILSAYLRGAQNLIYLEEYQEAKKLLEFALIISDDKSCYYLLHNCYKSLGNQKTSEFIKRKTSIIAENINLKDVEEFLMNLYNKNIFYRKLFIFGYKLLKKFS